MMMDRHSILHPIRQEPPSYPIFIPQQKKASRGHDNRSDKMVFDMVGKASMIKVLPAGFLSYLRNGTGVSGSVRI